MIRCNRLELLQALQTVSPGLSPRDIVEQSSCFVFKNGFVLTYNDEICCRMRTPLLKEFTGAVHAKPLMDILSKMPEDEVKIKSTEAEFIVIGKKRKTGIRMEAEITLPYDHAEKPGKEWIKLHEDFVEAVSIVQECASRDESQFIMTCVHIHPKWIEACDNFQLSRFRLPTGITTKCLVRKESLKHIVNLEMSEFNETETWIHFRNPSKLVLSCRRYMEDFHDLKSIMNFEGVPTKLPKGLGDAAERAEVFSQENTDENHVHVSMSPGTLLIEGIGSSGWFKEEKAVKYDGPIIHFQIAPKLLREIVRRHNECEITEDKLKVNGGKFIYVTSLRPTHSPKKEGE